MKRSSKDALFLMLFVPALAPGCAWTTASPVEYGDRETEGVRVYDPKPLLVVTEKSAQVIFVPDFHRGYAIRFGALLSRNEVSLEAEEGTLSAFSSDVDTSTIASGIASIGREAVEQAKHLKALGGGATTGAIAGMQGVYEFVLSSDGRLVTLRRIDGEP